MKYLVFLEILALAAIVSSQTDESSSSCPEGLEKTVKEAFTKCAPPKGPEGSQGPPPPLPPPPATETNGTCPGKCLIAEFEEDEVLKEYVNECPEEDYPGKSRIDCIMDKVKERCPDAEFPPPGPPGGPQGGPPGGPQGGPPGGPQGGPPGGPQGGPPGGFFGGPPRGR